jgi:hypothetical protein
MRAARDLYESLAVARPRPPIKLSAMYGLARTEAALDDHDAAIEAFDRLDSRDAGAGAPPRPDAETVAGSLIRSPSGTSPRGSRAVTRRAWG